jgi:Carboxypeptidase regulatory-like domain
MTWRSAFLAALTLALAKETAPQNANTNYSIAGIVVDSRTGNAIRHAELTLDGEDLGAVADDGGRFRFDHLEAGKYRLYASAAGYVREGLNQHGALFTGVVVGDSLDSEHVTFRLHPQALIHGRVTDQNGEAVRNANVRLFAASTNQTDHPSFQAQSQTNDLGEYRFAHLLAGGYFVVLQTQPWYAQTGFALAPIQSSNSHSLHPLSNGKPDPALDVVYPITFYPGVTDERSASEISLSEGETAEANVPLQAVPAVHLRVTNLPGNKNGAPALRAYQRVFGTLPVGLPLQTAEISDGELEIAGLPPGNLTFVANQGDAGRKERTVEANVSDGGTLDASKPLSAAIVSGRVVLPEGSGTIGDADIMLFKEGAPASFIRLKKDGSFALGALPLDTYRIAVNFPGEPNYIQKVSVSGAKVNGRDLILTGTNDVRLTIVMGRGFGQVSGVVMRDNHGVDGVMVLLVPDSGINLEDDSRLDQSDSDGSFQLGGIIPGKYRLLAIQDGWSLDRRNLAVLKPYLEKSELLQISSGESRKITVEVQKRVTPTAAAN